MVADVPAAAPALLQQLVAEQARRQPQAPALWWQGQVTSYAALQAQIERLSGALAGTGQVGDRIGVLAWNCPLFLMLIYAVPAAGRVLVPLNARLAPAELQLQIEEAGVSLLFADSELLAPLAQGAVLPTELVVLPLDRVDDWLDTAATAALPACDPAQPVWILYTSGSTGRPKGAVLTHHSFLAGLRSALIGRPVQSGDRFLYPFPLFHVAAHNVLLQHWQGAGVVLLSRFEAVEVLAACRQLKVTAMSLAPTMIAMLLDHPDYRREDLASVRSIGYGASAMPADLLQRLLQEADIDLCQSYGMTELSGSVAFLTPEDHRRAAREAPHLLASVGRPLSTAELRLLDDHDQPVPPGERGEIVVRAAQCLREYWRQPEATAAALVDGWLHTGDIGRFDEEGYLYIVDRKKDMVLSGGENVASREVEEVLRRHPAVRDCAVIGLPDARWGEAVTGVVVLDAEASDEALRDHCRNHLAGYKTPRRFFRVDALPLNAAGKVDKPSLRRRFAGEPDTATMAG